MVVCVSVWEQQQVATVVQRVPDADADCKRVLEVVDCFGHHAADIEQEFVNTVYYHMKRAPDGEESMKCGGEGTENLQAEAVVGP